MLARTTRLNQFIAAASTGRWRFGFSLALALAVLSASAVQAAPWSILGGRTLDVRNSGLRIGAGYPDVHVAYHVPITSTVEVAGKVGLNYGYPAFGTGGTPSFVGNTLGGELRWNVYSESAFHVAVKGEVGLNLYYNLGDDFRGGMRLSPGVVADYEVSETVNLITGLEVPVDFIFGEPVSALIPILFNLGLEFLAKENLLFFVNFKVGPAVFTAGGASDTGFGFDGRLGLAFRF